MNNSSMSGDDIAAATAAAAAAAAVETAERTTFRDETAEQGMTMCPRCRHEVPSSNLVVHSASCGKGQQQQQEQEQEQATEAQTMDQPTGTHSTESQATGGQPAFRSGQRRQASNASSSNLMGWRNFLQRSPVLFHPLVHSASAGSVPSIASSPVGPATAASPSTMAVSSSSSNNNNSHIMGTASVVGNIRPPAPRNPSNDGQASQGANSDAHNGHNSRLSQFSQSSVSPVDENDINNVNPEIHIEPNQWSCPRCTLINQEHDVRCDACLSPRPPRHTTSSSAATDSSFSSTRSPDAVTTDRLVPPSLFSRSTQNHATNANNNDDATRNSPPTRDRPNTVHRVFNGAMNGAMIGSIFGGLGGMLVGGIAGAASGALSNGLLRARGDQQENDVEALLQQRGFVPLGDDSSGSNGTGGVRVLRGPGHILAVSDDTNGRMRILRVRYGSNRRAGSDGDTLNNDNNSGGAGNSLQQPSTQLEDDANFARQAQQEELEQALMETLFRMGNFRNASGRNVVFQPGASFEELLEQLGMGTENRGASREVIDSYPVEVVGGTEQMKGENNASSVESSSLFNSHKFSASNGLGNHTHTDDNHTPDGKANYGTCGICLEDYEKGDTIKKLSCPNHPHVFHKNCIDKWLAQVASCPICKNDVGMYVPPPSDPSQFRQQTQDGLLKIDEKETKKDR